MTPQRQLAVLLRKTQWLLDDIAHQLAAHRSAQADLVAVAEVLDEVATALRGRIIDLDEGSSNVSEHS